MNDHLKIMGRKCKFNETIKDVYFVGAERFEETYKKWELLTTHCGRRSFVVNSLYLGIPAEVVMKWTGHKDFESMKPYIAIVDDLKKRDIAEKSDFVIEILESDKDHIHFLINYPPNISVTSIVRKLKQESTPIRQGCCY